MTNASTLIEELQLLSHPEGGYYREMYRSPDQLAQNALPSPYSGDRAVVTSIYFLLKKGEKSRYHRLASDELWFFHAGNPVTIYLLPENGKLASVTLGNHPAPLQALIPKNTWFAAVPREDVFDFTLVSCVVAPGFSFEDFELADSQFLKDSFPQHAAHITDFT